MYSRDNVDDDDGDDGKTRNHLLEWIVKKKNFEYYEPGKRYGATKKKKKKSFGCNDRNGKYWKVFENI